MIALFIIIFLALSTLAAVAHQPLGKAFTPRPMNRDKFGSFRYFHKLPCYPFASPVAFNLARVRTLGRAVKALFTLRFYVESRDKLARSVVWQGLAGFVDLTCEAFSRENMQILLQTVKEEGKDASIRLHTLIETVKADLGMVPAKARSIAASVRHKIAYRVALVRSLPFHARYTTETVTDHVYDLNPVDVSGVNWIVPVERSVTYAHPRPWFAMWCHLRAYHAGKIQIAGAFAIGLALGLLGGCEGAAVVLPFGFTSSHKKGGSALLINCLSEYDGTPISVVVGDTGNRKTDRTFGVTIVSQKLYKSTKRSFSHTARRNSVGMKIFRDTTNGACADACPHKEDKTCYVGHNVQSIGQPLAMCAHAEDLTLETLKGSTGRSDLIVCSDIEWALRMFRELLDESDSKLLRMCVLGSMGALPKKLRVGMQRIGKAWKESEKDRAISAYIEEMDKAPDLAPSHMASASTIERAEHHIALGRRVFASLDPRDLPTVEGFQGPGIQIPAWSRLCPASKEWSLARGEKSITCAQCKACDGLGSNGDRKSRIIMRHDIKSRSQTRKAFSGMAIYDDRGRFVGQFAGAKVSS